MSRAAATETKRDKETAKDRERYQSRVGERLCVDCGGPLGERGTDRSCRPCLDHQNRQHQEGRSRRFESGLCPQHGTAMLMLERCPACSYEQSGGRITDLTFEGLLPPPSSGDELEACVGCENCERLYHAGSSYRVPPIPRGLKLKDERVGAEGYGIWLRFAEESELGVEAEYQGCSTPEKKCARRVSKNVALKYLTAQRKGEQVPGRCYEHFRNPAAYEEVIAARLRHQLDATAQPQNGNGQGSGDGQKRRPGAPKGSNAAITVEALDDAFNRISDDATQEQIAEAIGVSDRALRDWKRPLGLKWRGVRLWVSQNRK